MEGPRQGAGTPALGLSLPPAGSLGLPPGPHTGTRRPPAAGRERRKIQTNMATPLILGTVTGLSCMTDPNSERPPEADLVPGSSGAWFRGWDPEFLMAGPEADPRATPVSLGHCMGRVSRSCTRPSSSATLPWWLQDGASPLSHRLVLGSVSPYLRDQMASTDSQGGEVQLQDVSPSIRQSILHYLYTEELALTAECAQELFVTASRLQIPPLLEMVGR
ncbi:uncharacterized protein LOC120388124 [Mauremys reevesii]|uniref:uncharacterized protein LOC120388124 n=1 Tax=Mauremys reevesii TaxID=260615 RepID=UPI00193F293F|nr:uncharacterized protein LOC120388124 [Mauremys reevesii]